MYCSQMRTTMVVRLHPGQSKILSAFLDSKVICNLNPTIFSLMHNKILEFLLCILDQTPKHLFKTRWSWFGHTISNWKNSHCSGKIFIKSHFRQEELEINSRSWSGDVQYDNNPSSICGLEISFSSVPQDIDIKLIPGNQFCNINNPGMYQAR